MVDLNTLPLNEPFNIGFVGGGLNSAIGDTHRVASQMDARFILQAGCFSRNSDVNLQTGRAWGVKEERVYEDWHSFLDKEKGKLDAVVVLTPIPDHAEIVLAAIEKGFAVICEKALTNSSVEAKKINDLVEKRNAFLAMTYNYSGYPMLREMKMMIAQGEIGKVSHVDIEMPQEGFLRVDKEGASAKPQQWRLEDLPSLPTVSLDLGVHLHQVVGFLTGEVPLEVTATEDRFGKFENIIDNVMCLARYSGSVKCNFWYSKSSLGHRNGLRIRVYGSEGAIEWYQMDPEHIHYCNKYGQKSILDRTTSTSGLPSEPRYNRFKAGHSAGFIEAFANQYYDIADSLAYYKKTGKFLEKSHFVFGGEVAEEGLLMLEAIHRSASRNAWEKL